VQRREWFITVGSGFTPTFTVQQRRLGTISAIGNLSIEDEEASYDDNELVGWRLHVLEQEQDETFDISANTATSITVSGLSTPGELSSLLTLATNGDSYVVETDESVTGKIGRSLASGTNNAGQPVVNTQGAPHAAFTNDARVLLRDGDDSAVLVIASVGVSSITFTTNLPFAMTNNATLDWYWQSDDGSVGFALVQGSTVFASGDTLYVDTYPVTGDIKLRREEFLKFNEDDWTIRTIGGIQ
jgi:hypothetical protein